MQKADSFEKRPWCWEGLGAGGEGDNRGWDSWMVSPTQWTWDSLNSGNWWWTGRPGVLQSMRLQRVGHNWGIELNWSPVSVNDELAEWHHRLDGHEFGWTPGVGNGQGGLACCDSWGRQESDTTELNWTEWKSPQNFHVLYEIQNLSHRLLLLSSYMDISQLINFLYVAYYLHQITSIFST